MDILNQLFHSKEIEKLLETCPDLKYLKKENTRKILKLLADYHCNNRVLRFVILKNPFFLLRDITSIEEVFHILDEYGVENIDMAIYTYPYLLSKSAYEIDNFYIKKHQEGYSNDDINEMLEVQGYLLDEIE